MTTDLSNIEERLSHIERRLYGGWAVYMGENRVLTRANWHDLMYLVDSRDRLIAPKLIMSGVFEADVSSFFLSNVKLDSICVDVGANFGYYTCMFGKLAPIGHTTGFEADPETFELLRDNVAINWLDGQCTILNRAISDAEGELTLYRRDRRSGNTSITDLGDRVRALGESPSTPFTVPAVSLDELFPGRVDFLKVDVEGAEPLVMRGATRLIGDNPDINIVMEWSPIQIKEAGFDPPAFAKSLEGLGLQASAMHYDGTQTTMTWNEVSAAGYGNLLMSHRT